jgi:hypothetical protein
MTMRLIKKLRAWLIGAGVLGGVTVYIMFARSHWMPAPNEGLERYVCPDQQTIVYYRHHGNSLRIETPLGMRVVSMHYDQIEWGDYEIAATVLGFRPPTTIKYGDLRVLRLGGGQLNDVECHSQTLQ